MDIELRAISALLHSNRATQEQFYITHPPKSVFQVRSREIEWVFSFREKHGVYPSPKAFSHHFDEPLRKIRDPINATLQPILDMAMFEQLRLLQERAKTKLDKGAPVAAVMEYFRAESNKLVTFSSKTSVIDTSISLGAEKRYRQIVRNYEDKGLIDTPWPTMNKTVKYMRAGEVVTLSSRMALGKSWTVVEWGEYWAHKGIRTGLFTKEMPAEQFEDRIECHRYKISHDDYREGALPPRELRRWRESRRRDSLSGKKVPLFIFGDERDNSITLESVAARCREFSLEAVWIDGAYLIRPPELPANASDQSRFSYISNRAKELAKNEKIVLGLVVQDNREAEGEDGVAKGGLRTLFGADAWGQDSDWVFNLRGKRGTNRREIALIKGRESNLAEIAVSFDLDPPALRDMGSVIVHRKVSKSKKLAQQHGFNTIK